jgi:hypothetical protein
MRIARCAIISLVDKIERKSPKRLRYFNGLPRNRGAPNVGFYPLDSNKRQRLPLSFAPSEDGKCSSLLTTGTRLDCFTAAFAEAMHCVRKSAGGALIDRRALEYRDEIISNLTRAYELRERGPSALKRSGPRNVLAKARNIECPFQIGPNGQSRSLEPVTSNDR